MKRMFQNLLRIILLKQKEKSNMLGNYKKWTGKEREASYKITKIAMKDGILPIPSKCNRCRQAEVRNTITKINLQTITSVKQN